MVPVEKKIKFCYDQDLFAWSPSFGNVIRVPSFHPAFRVKVKILSLMLDVCPSSFMTCINLWNSFLMSPYDFIFNLVCRTYPTGYLSFFSASIIKVILNCSFSSISSKEPEYWLLLLLPLHRSLASRSKNQLFSS